MTKAELLAELASKVEKVGDPVRVESSFGVTTYDVPVLDREGTTATKRTVPIYVVDEGEPGEVAYFRLSLDRDEQSADEAYAAAAQDWLNQIVAAGTGDILSGELLETNRTNKFIVARVFVNLKTTPASAEERRYLVRRNADNTGWKDFFRLV